MHKTNNGDLRQHFSTNPKFNLKILHPHNHNPKYPNYVQKGNKEKKRKKKKREVGMIILG